jgi:1-deoxyxylulose-5-phosphate synthase
MEYQNLGSTGLKISRVVFGGAHIGEVVSQEKTKELVHAAWDAGVSTIYTGDDYNLGDGERFIGEAIKSRRDDVVIIAKTGYRVGAWTNYSKGGSPADGGEDYTNQRLGTLDHARLWSAGAAPTSRGMSRKHLTAALEASLRRLQTDYIDVYCPHYWDPEVPVEETIATLHNFVLQGKVRYLSCSQHTPWQLYRALWASDSLKMSRYEAVQANLSLLERGPVQNELPALREVGVSMLAGITDAGGMLSGDYDRNSERPSGGGARQRYIDPFWTEAAFDAMDILKDCAARIGRPVGEMAQAWVLAQEPVAALMVGAHEPEDFDTPAAAASKPLSADELAEINGVLPSIPVNVRPARVL